MTKQATAPPTRDKGAPTAPPPPPAWRHYLWLIASVIFIVLFFVSAGDEKSEAGHPQLFAVPP
jgi:cell division protease FtsH